MNASKFYERALIDLYRSRVLYFEYADEGTYFSKDGYTAFYIPRKVPIRNSDSQRETQMISPNFNKIGAPAVKIEFGFFRNQPDKRKKIVLLENENGISTFVRNTYFNAFPKKTEFYVSNPLKPVIAAMREKGKFKILGLIMPVRGNQEDFIKFEI